MRISWIRTVAAAMTALALAGCGGGKPASEPMPSPPSAPSPAHGPPSGAPTGETSPESRAGSIRSRLPSLEDARGTTPLGGVDASWIAYYAAGEPVYIRETQDRGDLGSDVEEYFFENGRIFFYAMEHTAREETISLRLAFGSDGSVVTSFKTVNGHRVDTAEPEAGGARERGALLLDAAKKARPG